MLEIPDNFREYYLRLGELHHQYTDLEHHFTCTVRVVVTQKMAGPEQNAIAYAVLGGMRINPLKDTIKRLLRVLQAPKANRDAVDKVFSHLGDIQFLRDRLTHHLTRPSADGRAGVWVNSDFAGVRELEKSTELEFKLDALSAASADLHALKWYIDDLFNDYVTWAEGFPQKPFDPDGIPAWQYKPSMLIQHRPKSSDSGKRSLLLP